MLSLVGYWYLTREKKQLEREGAIDLGDGEVGILQEVAPLHATFRLNDGSTARKPNAWLMREVFGLDRPAEEPEPSPGKMPPEGEELVSAPGDSGKPV